MTTERRVVIVFALLLIALVVNVYMFACCRARSPAEGTSSSTSTSTSTSTSKTLTTPAPAIKLSDDYEVIEIVDLLTAEQCDAIVAAAKAAGMGNAETIDIDNVSGTYTSYNPKFRTSKTVFLPDGRLPEIELLAAQAQTRTGLPRENQEQLQVAHYEVEGEFKDHYDACDASSDVCAKFNHGAGHRVATLLVYLNDDFDGGETVFPRIGKAVRPRKGKGVLFRNTDADEVILYNSLHRASQVTRGEKWICTKWTHPSAFPETI